MNATSSRGTVNPIRKFSVTARHEMLVPSHSSLDHQSHHHRFHHETATTSPGEYVTSYIHNSANQPVIPGDFLKIESLSLDMTPSPCARRATNRATVAAEAISSNRRQNTCRNLPPPTAGICRYWSPMDTASCRRWSHFVGDLITPISIRLNSVTIPLNSPTAR